MATGRCRFLGLASALLAIAPLGCAQSGPIGSRNTTLGSLKASVSQLEVENDKLRREVGELKADNSRLDTQLSQEREASGEYAARLDDAKTLLRRQGGDAQALASPSRSPEDEELPPPARRTNTRTRRAPPPAQIRRPEPFESGEERGFDSTSTDSTRDLGPADRIDDDRWLPVARGLGTSIRR